MGKSKGRFFIRTQKYVCGDYMDIDIYPVFRKRGKRGKKCKPSTEIQRKLNKRNAEKRLVRLAHLNFTEQDIALTLTYDIEPESPEEAQRILYNFFQRIKRNRKKAGLSELKYISVTEQGKKSGRLHHHVIMSGGLDRDLVEKVWGRGYANSRRLQFGADGISGLVHYITKGNLLYRGYNCSKNLDKPVPVTDDKSMTLRGVKALTEVFRYEGEKAYFETMFSGYGFTEGRWIRNDVNGRDYFFITMYKYKQMKASGGCVNEEQDKKRIQK